MVFVSFELCWRLAGYWMGMESEARARIMSTKVLVCCK